MSHADRLPDAPVESPLHLVPRMRFTLRTLLLASSAVALLAAALGPTYRAAHPDNRSMLLAFWFGMFAPLPTYACFQWQGHVRRLAHAGPVRFRLRRPDLPQSGFVGALCGLALFAYSMMVACFGAAGLTRSSGADVAHGLLSGTIIGFFLVAAIHLMYRPFARNKPIALCEHGVIVRRRVLPWGGFMRASWRRATSNWLILHGSERAYAAEAPPALRDAVEAFVGAKTHFDSDD